MNFFKYKLILKVLILILSFHNLSIADDISEFEIEGKSIGESLLDYYSKKEISNAIQMNYPKSDKYVKYQFKINNSDYDSLSFHIK